MELKQSKKQVQELDIEQPEEAEISVQNAPKIVFRRSKHPEKTFNWFDDQPMLIRQEETNQTLIVALMNNDLKLYEIKENKISFASQHTIQFPVQDLISSNRLITDKTIFLLFKKSYLKTHPLGKLIFKEGGISPDSKFHVLVHIPIGTSQPKLIKPMISEAKCSESETRLIKGVFKSQKHFTGSHLSLEYFDKEIPEEQRATQKAHIDCSDFICEIPKRPNSLQKTRRLFKILAPFKEQPFFRNKLKADVEAYTKSTFGSKLGFLADDCRHIVFKSKNLLNPKKFKAFFQVGPKMITILLIELRTRKIAARGLVSCHELFKDQEERAAISDLFSCMLTGFEYCLEADLLIFDASVTFAYLHNSFKTIRDRFTNQNGSGSVDKGRMAMFTNTDTGSVQEKRMIRFRV